MDKKPVCKFCNRTRILLIAIAIIAFLAFMPEFDFLWEIDTTKAFAWAIAAAVGVLVLWKAYNEFWKK